MPELPDIIAYLDALTRLLGDRIVLDVQVRSPFVVRTVEPALTEITGQRILGFERLGKRILWRLEQDLTLVIHLMIAGRFHWRKVGAQARGKNDLVAFRFEHGVLMLTEASPKRRASIHVLRGRDGLQSHRREGLEILQATAQQFRAALLRENHTLKRALTDPNLFSGVGNAYSDEILHQAGLSPLKWTRRLTNEEIARLHQAAVKTLSWWCDRLLAEAQQRFPEKVTAFRPEMAVHGKFQQPCPACRTPVQRIVYADNETNYCPTCQTKGKLLADRSLSRLLKQDWPRSLEELD